MKPLQTLLTAGPVLAALVCASPALAGDKSAPKSDAAAEAPKLAVPDAARFQLAARYSAARKGVSLLVLHKGRRIHEAYANRGGRDVAWHLASGTKSFCAAIALIAEKEGLLELDEPVSKTITEWTDAARKPITIRELLSLVSGIPSGRGSLRVTYAESVKRRPDARPNTRFQYGQVPFQIFGELMTRKLEAAGLGKDGIKSPRDYLEARLFKALELKVERWKTDADGNPMLGHGAHLTAREWAKFGEWLRRGGTITKDDKTVALVDRAALAKCFQPSKAGPAYGLCFWLNRPIPKDADVPVYQHATLAHPLVPKDVVMAAGAGDQRCYLIPSLELVVVRQARGVLMAVFGRRSGFTDAELLCRLLRGCDGAGTNLIPSKNGSNSD